MSILETYPLVRRLVEEHRMPLVETDLPPAGLRLLFLPSHERQHLETPDIAAVLPDLLQVCRKLLPEGVNIEGAVAGSALEARLGAAIDGLSLPALIVMDGQTPIGVIARMRDWADYLARFKAILAPLAVAH
ncbi:hydrogenase-1 expression HyaE [Beijerinckia indica]|uniref:Hydrogenase-1 expression HyaE n=1 Tax=Beijerinckia indica subsp. indica (strain ATCC 9039 / DSM 1715 / NCIMB 8712) TaxID=395963 RepID=B2IJ34_BEII9|nr:hydrogenase-1 expression HyaE [Beijerinckia indica]ACB94797.1 hydrogenase-1 expression HyaE [Beijerinckia indica subsp. indica ATCC 9039]